MDAPATIVDRYLSGTTLRLRRVQREQATTWKLSQKARPDPTSPERVALTTIYLTEAEYERLRAMPAAELRKDRRHFRWADHVLAVDVFLGRHEGLVLAEVELGVDDPFLPPPPSAVADVTHDDRFSGGSLAAASDGELALIRRTT